MESEDSSNSNAAVPTTRSSRRRQSQAADFQLIDSTAGVPVTTPLIPFIPLKKIKIEPGMFVPKSALTKKSASNIAKKGNGNSSSSSSSSKKKSTATATTPKIKQEPVEVISEPRTLRRRATRSSRGVDSDVSPSSEKQQSEPKYRMGDKLEAQDEYGKWYSARVANVDETGTSVLIHFDYWSTRYDEWMDMKSKRLRPMLEQPPRVDKEKVYNIGDYVLAKWSMWRYFPAKILDIVDENRFNVLFYDGVESVVKRRELRRMPEEEFKKLDLEKFGQPGYSLTPQPSASSATSPEDESATSSTEELASLQNDAQDEALDLTAADPSAPTEEKGFSIVTQPVKKKERFLTTTQKWMLKQKGESRIRRKAAIGVAIAVAQLTPISRKTTPKTTGTTTVKEETSASASKKASSKSPQSATSSAEKKKTPTSISPSAGKGKSPAAATPKKEKEGERSWSTKTTPEMEKVKRDEFLASPKEKSPSPVTTTSYDHIAWPKPGLPIEGPADSTKRKLSFSTDSVSAMYYRAQKFKPEWQSQFDWLSFDEVKMWCKYCRQAYPEARHGFVHGITSGFLVHRLEGHEASRFHVAAAERFGLQSKTPDVPDESTSDKEAKPAAGDQKEKRTSDVSEKNAGRSSTEDSEEDQAQRLFEFWRTGREAWLRVENKKLFCKACRLHGQNTPGQPSLWSIGIPSSQANNIFRHAQSTTHQAALQHLLKMEQEGKSCTTPPPPPTSSKLFVASLPFLPRELPVMLPTRVPTPAKSDQASRKRKKSGASEVSMTSNSTSRSMSTVTAVETPMSGRSSAMDRKRGPPSDPERSSRASSLSHLAEDDVVRCVCETGGEDGLMLQCEQCMTWQHGNCVGIEEPSATPTDYICYICKNPPGARATMRYRYDVQKTWLETGTLPRYPWSPREAATGAAKTRITLATNGAARTVAMLNDRLRAARSLLLSINKLPHGSAMIERKAALKNEIVAIQEAVEKELDNLEPFVAELENKYLGHRLGISDPDFYQSKLAVCQLISDLDKLRKLGYFLQ